MMLTSLGISSSSGNLNELEAKINTLEKANFDLKLRLHYLNKKHGGKDIPGYNPVTNGSSNKNNFAENSELVNLREENEYSRKRIIELESELLQLQLTREREAENYQRALKLKPTTAVHLEEQRKREREVAVAIAEHDAALISRLQEELSQSQRERLNDQQIVDSLTEQLNGKIRILEVKDNEISDLYAKIKLLTSQAEKASIQVSTPAFSSSTGNIPLYITAIGADGQPTQLLVNSSNGAFSPVKGSQGASLSVGDNIVQTPSYQRYQMEMTATAPYNQVTIIQENKVLRDRLEQLQDSISNQDKVIALMKASAAEFSNIGNGEILRLESELKILNENYELVKAKYQKLENEYDHTMKELLESRRETLRLTTELSQQAPSAETMQKVSTPLNLPHKDSVQINPSHQQSSTSTAVNKDNNHLELLSTSATLQASNSFIPISNNETVDKVNNQQIEAYEKSIELFKQRENELLAALEGVVRRCQELEGRQGISSRNRTPKPRR